MISTTFCRFCRLQCEFLRVKNLEVNVGSICGNHVSESVGVVIKRGIASVLYAEGMNER